MGMRKGGLLSAVAMAAAVMSDTTTHRRREEVAEEDQVQVKKKANLLGRMQVHPGQKLYQLNLITNKIEEPQFKEAELEQSKHPFTGKVQMVPVRKLIIKENCIYVSALNEKNARRKFDAKIHKARLGL